jgi:hypothetical protein
MIESQTTDQRSTRTKRSSDTLLMKGHAAPGAPVRTERTSDWPYYAFYGDAVNTILQIQNSVVTSALRGAGCLVGKRLIIECEATTPAMFPPFSSVKLLLSTH